MFRWRFRADRNAVSALAAPDRQPAAETGAAAIPVALPQRIGLALQHHQAGRLSEAEAAYREILSVDPENIDALHFLGVIAYQSGNHERAVDLISQSLSRNAANAPAHNNLGNAFKALGKTEEAFVCFQKALALKPDFADAHVNMGAILREESKLEEAVACHRKALALRPDLADAHFNLANALVALGRLQEAEESYRRALALPGNPARIKFACALLKLLQGDYDSGLQLYETRFEEGALPGLYAGLHERSAAFQGTPRWQGEDLASKTLMVWTDHGLGDSIMMMRYLPLLKNRRAGRLMVYCEPALARLVQTMAAVDRVVPMTDPLPRGEFQLQCPMMSLPLIFKTRVESIPRNVPYLFVPHELRQEWTRKLAGVVSPRVGLVWAGAQRNSRDALRSVKLKQFSPWLGISNATFVSLQKGEAASQLEGTGWQVLDWMDECEDLLDTAALIEQLDLVISVDTSVAHLAGALGKPVWLMNRFESEWRWMLEREDSPWYPSIKIFRQRQPGSWYDVIARVGAALKTRCAQPLG